MLQLYWTALNCTGIAFNLSKCDISNRRAPQELRKQVHYVAIGFVAIGLIVILFGNMRLLKLIILSHETGLRVASATRV